MIKYGDQRIRLVPSLMKESDVRKYRDWFDKVHRIKKAQREGRNAVTRRAGSVKKTEDV